MLVRVVRDDTKVSYVVLTLVFLALTIPPTGCRERGSSGPEQPSVVVFVAASLRDVVREIGDLFSHTHNVDLVYNFAGSNTLAQQLQASPSADVFLSANPDWVDVLEKADVIIPQSRRNFLSNRLVIIGRKEAAFHVFDPGTLTSLSFTFLAMADPEAVPAGRYARTFLQSVETEDRSVWEAVKDKIVPTADVRAALGLVESDPNIIGLVYRTDAASSDRVKILYEIPPNPHQPIIYCAVAIKDRPQPELTAQFLNFLSSSEAVAIYNTQGFVVDE